MWRRAKQAKWGSPVVVLLLIGQILFNGPVLISKAAGVTGSGPSSSAYWSNCVNLARQQAGRPQNPEPSSLDSCYLTLLGKFGMKLLSDISTNPLDFFASLQQMKETNQQPSVVQLFIHLGATGYSSIQEKQELISVDSSYVDQGKVDPKVVVGYNAAIDKPLFDQFVKQQLPTLSSQRLDQWFTSTILTIPAVMKQTCDARQPHYNPLPRVDSPHNDAQGDLQYNSGQVVDGIANVYLVFWIDAAFQPARPTYVSLIQQFVKDIGQSPLYAILSQYRDALGRCPTGARLAGTLIDRQPFPPDLVAQRNSPNTDASAMDKLADQVWRQELTKVTAKQGWNMQDYHNIIVLLPTMNLGCGYHTNFDSSPYAFVSYPSYKGQEQCSVVPQSPNHDHVVDIATGILSHELMESASDPNPGSGWDGPNRNGEVADKCPLPPDTIDSATKGNVTWNGHHYAIQEEYSNLRHGCVLEGP